MSRNIRVVAKRHDPIIMDRLVRLLIAQAHIELTKQRLAEQVESARLAKPSSEPAS